MWTIPGFFTDNICCWYVWTDVDTITVKDLLLIISFILVGTAAGLGTLFSAALFSLFILLESRGNTVIWRRKNG